ncbi:hypothetical protein Pla123a_49250 [Posidoniimonas polymericola]|uniref:Uncharacterized protein n=1 Tax=Posidoniimonas polymericola TaxID=2528002 RepID=A0A5C5XR85_9BACT|nr:hypothetical protein [Posidoniimonas polymericola]TWT65168.1 hypothetical protein Pla123a_49250 [Posidoniimonas polymericola]
MILWTLTGLLAAFSVLIVVGNPVAGICAERDGRTYSFVPFVGGIAGAAAILICPLGLSPWWLLVPLVADVTFPMFFYVLLSGGLFR